MKTTATKAASKAAPKVGIVSLGCPKALVDSERILTLGFQLADLLGQIVALGLHLLPGRLGGTALGVQGQDLAGQSRQAAPRPALVEGLRIVPDPLYVEHRPAPPKSSVNNDSGYRQQGRVRKANNGGRMQSSNHSTRHPGLAPGSTVPPLGLRLGRCGPCAFGVDPGARCARPG